MFSIVGSAQKSVPLLVLSRAICEPPVIGCLSVTFLKVTRVVLGMVACPAVLLAGKATPPSSITAEPGFRVELLHSALEAEGS